MSLAWSVLSSSLFSSFFFFNSLSVRPLLVNVHIFGSVPFSSTINHRRGRRGPRNNRGKRKDKSRPWHCRTKTHSRNQALVEKNLEVRQDYNLFIIIIIIPIIIILLHWVIWSDENNMTLGKSRLLVCVFLWCQFPRDENKRYTTVFASSNVPFFPTVSRSREDLSEPDLMENASSC